MISQTFKDSESPYHEFSSVMSGTVVFTTDFSNKYSTPIQRLPRYELLLKDLLRKTTEDHHDYPHIKQSLSDINKINIKVNQLIAQSQNDMNIKKLEENTYLKRLLYKEDKTRRVINDILFVHELNDIFQDRIFSIKDPNSIEELKPQILFMDDCIVSPYHFNINRGTTSTIPIPLIWIDTHLTPEFFSSLELPGNSNLNTQLYFKITGPNETWIIKSIRDSFVPWIRKLAIHMKLDPNDEVFLMKGERDGSKVDYKFINIRGNFIGSYCGNWLNGIPHGKGVFKRSDGHQYQRQLYWKLLWKLAQWHSPRERSFQEIRWACI
uniref:DH domain-containing protein n=1 Tax=Arcella intermedia TaxID=1963864 RepID=A0A6B2L899_9EUKA